MVWLVHLPIDQEQGHVELCELLGQNFLTNKENIKLRMLCSCMEDLIVSNGNCTLIVTKDNRSVEGNFEFS